MKNHFLEGARACLENGDRLLFDAEMLSNSSPTSLALAIIAEEEFAKGFLLCLVDGGVIPWSKAIQQASRDHKCKHLLSMIMEYCDPEIEEMSARHDRRMARYDERRRLLEEITSISSQMLEETQRMTSRMWSDADERAKWRERRDQLRARQSQLGRDYARLDYDQQKEDSLPPPISDAINILRNEKVLKYERGYGLGDKYDRVAQKVTDGTRDRQKQAALYVEVDSMGKVSSRPERIDDAAVASAVERARRLRWFLEGLPEHGFENGLESQEVVRVLRFMFATREELRHVMDNS